MELHFIGVDLGNLRGEVVVRKEFSRTESPALHRQRTRRFDWHGSLHE